MVPTRCSVRHMNSRGAVARALASAADLFVARVEEPMIVRQRRGVLEVGPGADDNEIATVACRRLLAIDGMFDERAVAALVESYGFDYLAPAPMWSQARDHCC